MTASGSESPASDEEASSRQDGLFVAALDHCWKWVDSSLTRRIQQYNFYLVSLAFLTAGFFTAIAAKQQLAAIFIAIVGVYANLGYWYGDNKVRKYGRTGENALIVLQNRLAAMVDCDELRLAERIRTDIDKNSMRTNLALTFLAGIVIWIGATIYAVITKF